MATTRLEYTGDGNTVTFSLGTIDLINRSDLKVYIFEPSRDSNTAVLQAEATNAGTAGTSHSQYDASNTSGSAAGSIAATTPVNNYQFNSGNTQITLNFDNGVAKPSANALITLERITSELQSDFSSQGTIRASELNSELRRIQHIAEEGVNEAKLSIKESRFSANAVDVAHPVSGIDRRIEHVANADSDDDAVNRAQLRKVIFDDLIEGEGINLSDATGGTNSNGQTTISGEDSSKTNKGIVTINEGEAIDVNYTAGNAVISSENSTKSNKGAITVNSGHGIKVGPSDESDAGYDGNAVVSADRSTPTAQGIIKVNQVSGDAINVTHAVGGTVGDVTVGVDRATASQQGVVRVQSSVPITTTYTADGEVNLSIPDNTVDLAKIRNDDVITSSELAASTTTSNYPTPDWDSDDSIATGKALAKRFDAIYYSHTTNKGTPPTETNWVEGKLWYDHLNDQTFSIWDKTGANTGVWRAITSGGTFTSQPKVVYVDSVNGNDLNDGHRIIKAKKTIRGALLDVNENITATTTTNVTAATYNHETGLLEVTTNANHNLRVGMKVTMAGLVWSCNYGGGTNNHTFPEADDPLRFVSNILSNTQFECQLETTVDTTLAHTYVSGGTVTNQAGRVGQGWMISVSAGTYQEILPLRVEADNVSIVGTTMRSCFIHPSNTQRYDTSKDFNASDAVTTGTSEYNTMFEMNSGTYIWGFAFSGMKAGGWTTSNGSTASARGDATGYVPEANRNEQRTNVDPHATYGLPPVHGWIAAFRPNCSLKKSPYIQNCTSISDTDINNAAYDPVTQTGGLGGDKDSGMTAGGILVDGSVPSATSPLRSFVVDAFTQINMDGPGILCTNNGYAQLVSFFGTFCHYHAKSLNGGMLNLANCTTDYGRYGLIADGKSATTTFTSTVDGAESAGATQFDIDATTITSGYHGTGFNNSTANLRPGDNYLVSIGSDTYEIVSAVPKGGTWSATSGWTVTIMKTNATNPAVNDGLANAITDGATVNFYQRSYISTGGHTFEYVGAGTDYRAAPENGGVPIEAYEVVNLNMGKVWQSSTNHVGKFKVGETFTIDQRSGKVESKGLTLTGPVTTNGNDSITIDPAGNGSVTIGSPLNINGAVDLAGNIDITGHIIPDSNAAHDLGTIAKGWRGLYLGDNSVIKAGNSQDFHIYHDNTDNLIKSLNGKIVISTTAGNSDIEVTPHGSGKVKLDGLSWPVADGTANHYLKTDGSGNLSFAPVLSATSPTISNPTVTGNLVVTDNLRLNDDDDSNHITITSPATVGTDYVLTLPAAAPSANQYLKAGASTPGNLEWENQLAITTVQTAANESAMLGLTTQEGDVVIRTDESKTYIKNSGTAGSMADFTHLVSPTATVTTVDGHSGTVTANDIRDAVESATDSNTFTDAESSKLAGVATSANNYTHPNHSGEVTSSADGAQTIASNVVDEDNLKISNAGTNGQFLQKQSGNTGGLTWETVDLTNLSASNLTSGTVPDARFPATLPAISGANLTNLPGGGSSFTAVADGSIAANKAVVMDSTGKVKQVGETFTTQSPPTYHTSIANAQSSYKTDLTEIAADPDNNRVAYLFNKAGGSGSALVIGIGLDNGSTGVYGFSGQTQVTNDYVANEYVDIVYTGNSQYVTVFAENAPTGGGQQYRGQAKVAYYSNSSQNSVTVTSAYDFESAEIDQCTACEGGTNKFIVMWRVKSNQQIKARIGTVSGTGSSASISWGSVTTLVGGSNKGSYISQSDAICQHPSTPSYWTLTYGKQTNGTGYWDGIARRAWVSGSSVGLGGEKWFHTGSNSYTYHGYSKPCFDPDSGRMVIMYRQSNVTTFTSATYSGHNVIGTFGSMFGWRQSSPGGHSLSDGGLLHCSQTNRLIAFGQSFVYVAFTMSGNTPTWEAQVDPLSGLSWNAGFEDIHVVWTGRPGKFLAMGRKNWSNNRRSIALPVFTATAVSNLTVATNYPVGWVESAYSNGDTVTIKSVGNIQGGFSGLTTGTKYMLQGDGTLLTSADTALAATSHWDSNSPVAGRAISPTQIRIQDPHIYGGY